MLSACGLLMYCSTICFHLRRHNQPRKKLWTFLIFCNCISSTMGESERKSELIWDSGNGEVPLNPGAALMAAKGFHSFLSEYNCEHRKKYIIAKGWKCYKLFLHFTRFSQQLFIIVLPEHQFGFRGKHSTVEQVSRVVATITAALERKEYCPGVFVDVSRAFDRVWTTDLLHKLSDYLPKQIIILLLTSNYRSVQVYLSDSVSLTHSIHGGVPQGSFLGPLLFLLYTADLPFADNVTTATFADDTAVLGSNENYDDAVKCLQHSTDRISKWTKHWKIKLNSAKSARVDFSPRCSARTPTVLDEQSIPSSSNVRYLGIHLDTRLNRQVHINSKREELRIRFRSMFFWLFKAKSHLSLYNKRLLM